MSELDLSKLAAIDENVSHFFFAALALAHPRRGAQIATSSGTAEGASDELQLSARDGGHHHSNNHNNSQQEPHRDSARRGGAGGPGDDGSAPHLPSRSPARKRTKTYMDDDDDDVEENGEEEEVIRIPDTIVYSYSKPIQWYYFDEFSQRVMRRPQKWLNTVHIAEQLNEFGKSPTGLKAWYVFPKDRDTISPFASDLNEDIVSQQEVGPKGLLKFLQAPKGKGVLQAYLDNKSESDGSVRNVLILCHYSPSHFRTELCVGEKPLISTVEANEAKKSRSLKGGKSGSSSGAAVASGSAFAAAVSVRSAEGFSNRFSPHRAPHVVQPLVSAVVTNRLHRLCRAVTRRLRDMLGYTVASMSLVCRMTGKEDGLFVLWCSSLRLHNLRLYPNLSFYLSADGTKQMAYAMSNREPHHSNNTAAAAGAGTAGGSHPPRSTNNTGSPTAAAAGGDDPTMAVSQRSQNSSHNSKAAAGGTDRKPRSTQSAVAPPPDLPVDLMEALLSNLAVVPPSQPLVSAVPSNHAADGPTPPHSGALVVVPTSSSAKGTATVCCICRDPIDAGGLAKVPLQWVLYCLSLMDRHHQRLAHWDTRLEVPPSVALVCPRLTKVLFDCIVEKDHERRWLQTVMGVCVSCVEDCRRGNEELCKRKLLAPAWLGIDTQYHPLARLQQSRSSDALSAAMSKGGGGDPAALIAQRNLYFTPILEAASTRQNQIDAAQPTPLPAMNSSGHTALTPTHQRAKQLLLFGVMDANKIQRLQQQQQGTGAVLKSRSALPVASFISAAKDNPEAADLYRLDVAHNNVWKKVGFGRPHTDARSVPPTPQLFVNERLREGFSELRKQLEGIVGSSEESRVGSMWASRKARLAKGEETISNAPCQTPL